jgi:hypothetical protein
MAFHFVDEEEGFTQAETVKALDRWSEFESGTVTLSSIPSKYNAPPTFPAAQSGPFINVPVFPFPEESQAVVPFVSLNVQCATSPDALAFEVGVGVDDDVVAVVRMRLPGALGG